MSYNTYGSIEAEDFTYISNFKKISAGYASDGAILQHTGTGTAAASVNFVGHQGTYDIRITYFDENDGKSAAKFFVDGVQKASWLWDDNLGSSNAGAATRTTYIIRDVDIDSSATLRIEGARNGGEEFRVDRVDLLPPSDRAGPTAIPAFEGAEGFGSYTAGGRGGWIVKVTNLNDSGVGSLRWALEEIDVPRIVVFNVGGEIKLKDQIAVKGNVTVAGQTAPGDGITITGGRLHIVEDDVIIRGLHIRPGGGPGDEAVYRDAISVGLMDGAAVERVVIDHNSFSWSVDEVASVWGGARDVTYSNNIIAEALENSIHPEGDHSMGMLLGDNSSRITIVNNLYASNQFRNPQIDNARQVEFVNNLVYNYGNNALSVTSGGTRVATTHIIGNVFMEGDDSSSNSPVRLLGTSNGSKHYISDNLGHGRTSSSQPNIDIADGSGRSQVSAVKVFGSSNVGVMAARDVYEYVLANVGARADGLDSVDQRILNSVRNDSGKVIDSSSQVGGLNVKSYFTSLTDVDGDGIPNLYEVEVRSNPLVFDPHGDADDDGYTNIENYINGLISGSFTGNGGNGGGGGGSVPVNPGLIEAEDFIFVSGFVERSNPHASGGSYIQAVGKSQQAAEKTFTGPDGEYDLRLSYFDESDGVSMVTVRVNGVAVESWNWNKQLGSPYSDRSTLTSYLIEDVALDTGDIISITGFADGKEPLRIDSLFIDG